MDIKVTPSPLFGRINAIGSKSDIHRLLICSAFSDKNTGIRGFFCSDDISATLNCLVALGAKAEIQDGKCVVTPIKKAAENPVMDCMESGTTLRFLLPVVCAVCERASFAGRGRLPDRPIKELIFAIESGGVSFSGKKLPFNTKGKLNHGRFFLPGDVSSQYISGLITALCLVCGKSELLLTSPLESSAYVDMTLNTLKLFGAEIKPESGKYMVYGNGRFISPEKVTADGDWSNALFFMVAAAIGGNVEIDGLSLSSTQGDKAAVEILRRFGANIEIKETGIIISKGTLCACDIDISQIPDMLPALAVLAAFAKGTSVFCGGRRLRTKESDRISSTVKLLTDLGGKASETEDGITVYGTGELAGGIADGANDHRIVMAAAAAAAACKKEVIIKGSQAINKSYPTFFSDFNKLGGITDVI